MNLKKKAIMTTLLVLAIIEFAVGVIWGIKKSDCPTCLALSPFFFCYYAVIVKLILIPIIVIFRYFVLEKEEEKAKQVFSGIIIALLINIVTGTISFVLGSAVGFYMFWDGVY